MPGYTWPGQDRLSVASGTVGKRTKYMQGTAGERQWMEGYQVARAQAAVRTRCWSRLTCTPIQVRWDDGSNELWPHTPLLRASRVSYDVGTRVAREFSRGVFVGRITELYDDDDQMCEVTFTDGDREDLEVAQVIAAVELFKSLDEQTQSLAARVPT